MNSKFTHVPKTAMNVTDMTVINSFNALALTTSCDPDKFKHLSIVDNGKGEVFMGKGEDEVKAMFKKLVLKELRYRTSKPISCHQLSLIE